MEANRARDSLRAAQLCLKERLVDSAVSRAYFAMFQAAIGALERRGIMRSEWTHKAVHRDFVETFVQRRKIIAASFAGSLPTVMQLRHIGDYRQPGVSQRQAERAVRMAEEFLALLFREVFDVSQREKS